MLFWETVSLFIYFPQHLLTSRIRIHFLNAWPLIVLKLTRLSEPAKLNKYVQSIHLPPAGIYTPIGKRCLISGLQNNTSGRFWATDSSINALLMIFKRAYSWWSLWFIRLKGRKILETSLWKGIKWYGWNEIV